MPWTCQCTAMNFDTAEACVRCGRLLKQPSYNTTGWKVVFVLGALFLGGMVGLSMGAFGSRHNPDTVAAQSRAASAEPSAFRQSFDASFRNSCRASAMHAGNVSRAVADNYCTCALESFHKTHSMSQAAADCKKYVFR